MPQASLGTVLTQWGRIGCVGFGGPPAHIALLRKLCVDDRGWLDAQEFEDAVAACNLLPGPSSTQLAIFCAWRVRGRPGAIVGGLAFIVPGLIAILVLAALFLGDPPRWVEAAGAGAGAAVAAVALQAGLTLMPAGWQRAPQQSSRRRWSIYLLAGAVAAATVGPWLVLLLVACGAAEMLAQRVPTAPDRHRPAPDPRRPASDRRRSASDPHRPDPDPDRRRPAPALPGLPSLAAAAAGGGALLALAWTALKVGALSYGGGFVIIPLMRSDAVDQHGWMTAAEFLNAVALGQITPGPVVHTVAVVGYAAAGVGGGLLAAAVAFSPSFAFILLGADRFDRLRGNRRVRAFLDGAGPAAIGAILGSAVPLAAALGEVWQFAVLAGAAVLALALRRGPVLTLLTAAAAGVVIVLAGGPLPH